MSDQDMRAFTVTAKGLAGAMIATHTDLPMPVIAQVLNLIEQEFADRLPDFWQVIDALTRDSHGLE